MLRHFLYVVIAWDLLGSQAQGQQYSQPQNPVAQPQPTLVDQIAAHQQKWFTYNSLKETATQAKIAKMESLIESQLQAVQIKMGIELQALRNLMQYASEEQQEKLKASQRINASLFERIGSRSYYIERRHPATWFDAYNQCRQLGGHLATFYNYTQFYEVFSRVVGSMFWIDIYKMANKKQYVTSLTGRAPPYTNYKKDGKSGDCVYLSNGYMYSANCWSKYYFICQTEQWE
ncbi:accessory gland protein Acp29AB [Drosophila biarmipes]|uniref:accessory gland protein Acp29AB n=1 Tax=Drosophila biarmipes TaxID=125945 RepID=UPI0007E5F35A|nr:accessory gland protein Acp29AB [Drosophila biarmipes]